MKARLVLDLVVPAKTLIRVADSYLKFSDSEVRNIALPRPLKIAEAPSSPIWL